MRQVSRGFVLLVFIAVAGCGGGGPRSETALGTGATAVDAGVGAEVGADAGEAAADPALDLGTVARLIALGTSAAPERIRETVLAWAVVQARLGLREEALASVESVVEGVELAQAELAKLAEVYAALGMIDEVIDLTSRIEDAHDAQRPLVVGVESLAARGDCDLAERLLAELGYYRHKGGLQARIGVCAVNRGEPDRALEIIEACSPCRSSRYKGGQKWCDSCPASGVLELVARSMAETGDLAGAVGFVNARAELVENEVFSSITNHHAELSLKHKGGNPYWSAKEIRDRVEEGTAARMAELIGDVVVLGLKRGEREAALALIDEVDGAAGRDQVRGRVVRQLAGAGEVELALATARAIRGKKAKATALLDVSRALDGADSREQRIDLLREAYRLLRKVKVDKWISSPAIPVREELARVGDAETAWKAFRAARKKSDRCSGVGELLRAMVGAGMLERADRVMKACDVSHKALGDYLEACVSAGEHQHAVKSINRRIEREERVVYDTVGRVARACLGSETCQPALDVVAGIEAEGHRAYARFSVGVGLAEGGRIDEALELLPSLSGDHREELAIRVIGALMKAGEVDRALGLVSAEHYDPCAAKQAVAVGLAEKGRAGPAREQLKRCPHYERPQFWIQLAEGLLDKGDFVGAWDSLVDGFDEPDEEWRQTPVSESVDRALGIAAGEHLKARRFERALFYLVHLRRDRLKLNLLMRLAYSHGPREPPPEVTEPELLRLVAKRLGE